MIYGFSLRRYVPMCLDCRRVAAAFTIPALMALGLAGCSTIDSIGTTVSTDIKAAVTDVGTATQLIASDLPSACTAVSTAYATFESVAAINSSAGKPISSSTQSTVNTLMAGISVPCANPAAVSTPAGALQTAINTYAAIMQAIASTKAAQ